MNGDISINKNTSSGITVTHSISLNGLKTSLSYQLPLHVLRDRLPASNSEDEDELLSALALRLSHQIVDLLGSQSEQIEACVLKFSSELLEKELNELGI